MISILRSLKPPFLQFCAQKVTSGYCEAAHKPASSICSRLFHLLEAKVVVNTFMPCSWA